MKSGIVAFQPILRRLLTSVVAAHHLVAAFVIRASKYGAKVRLGGPHGAGLANLFDAIAINRLAAFCIRIAKARYIAYAVLCNMVCHLRVLAEITTSVIIALPTLAALRIGAASGALTQIAGYAICRGIHACIVSAESRPAALGVCAAIVARTMRIVFWQVQPLAGGAAVVVCAALHIAA